jgi:hypothetical protein
MSMLVAGEDRFSNEADIQAEVDAMLQGMLGQTSSRKDGMNIQNPPSCNPRHLDERALRHLRAEQRLNLSKFRGQ